MPPCLPTGRPLCFSVRALQGTPACDALPRQLRPGGWGPPAKTDPRPPRTIENGPKKAAFAFAVLRFCLQCSYFLAPDL